MTESATDVIVGRASRHESMALMVASSAIAHALFALGLFAIVATRPNEQPRPVMMVSLSGSMGPETPGVTQIGGLGVPEAKAPEPAPPPEARPDPRPEPPAPPKMTLPAEKTRTRPERPKTPEAPARATTAAPQVSQQPEPPQGNAPIDTGARGVGFGLSSAGGSGGASVMLDTNDFCCNEYLQVMVATIKRNWDQNAGGRGVTTMKFTISRDGRLSDIEIERSSGVMTLDRAAQRALALTTLQPLPDRYTNPTLTVHIKFEY